MRKRIPGRLIPLVALSFVTACSGRSGHAGPSEATAVRAESHQVDKALASIPRASDVVDSYHIEDEILTVIVVRPRWDKLGTSGQDALKKAVWQRWRTAYVQQHPDTKARIFLKVEDLQANDLGSYFE